MAKLSETFKLEGGSNTAPSSTKPKLSETFKLGQSLPMPDIGPTVKQTPVPEVSTIQQTSAPDVPTAQQTSDLWNYGIDSATPNYNEQLISTYENLPKTGLLDRIFSKQSRNAYKVKQELNPLYEQNKDAQTRYKLNSLGIKDEDVAVALMDGVSPYSATKKLIKSKGVTDEKELKNLVDATFDMTGRIGSKYANQQFVNFADEHPVLGTVYTFPLKVGSDLVGLVQNTADYISGNAISNTKGGNAGTQMVQEMRNAASDDLGNVGKFAYDVGTSIGDMLPVIALGGNAGLGYAGASAAQGSLPELVDRGLTPNQIMLSSVANGLAEAALEKLPLGNLEKWAEEPIEKSIKSIAKVVGSQMASEGIEEMGTDVINLITDNLINGDKSQFKQDEKEYGFNTALSNFVKQTVYDGLAGAVSGGVMGGGTGAINVARNGFYNPTNIPSLEQNTQTEVPTAADDAAVTDNFVPTKYANSNGTKPISQEKTNALKQSQKDILNNGSNFSDFVNQAKSDGTFNKNFHYATVSEELANDVYSSTGRNISDYNIVLNGSRVRHDLDSHGEFEETLRGQEIIKPENIEDFIKTFDNPDTITNLTTTDKDGNTVNQTDKENREVIKFVKRVNGTNNVVIGVGDGKGNLYVDTFYKTKAKGTTFPTVASNNNADSSSTSKTVRGMTSLSDSTINQTDNSVKSNDLPTLEKPKNQRDVYMLEDEGITKGKVKEIPTVNEGSGEVEFEVPVSELEDRRNGATYTADTAYTLENSDVFNQNAKARKMIESEIKNGNLDVERQTWLAAGKEAVDDIKENGIDKVKEKIMQSGTETTQTQIAESVYVVDNEIQKALKSGDTSEISRFTRRLVERMHKVGQALQAMRMYGNTAAGMVLATDTLAGQITNGYVNEANKNKLGKKAKAVKQNQKLAQAFKQIGYDGSMDVEKAPKTHQDYVNEVKATLDREMGSVERGFSDTDIEYLARLIEHGATTEELVSALNQHLATGFFAMSPEDIRQITELYNKADKATSKEAVALREQAAAIASKYLGDASFMDKWNSWRYLSMLGNPRTMIRNILGNFTFRTVTDVKDTVGALLEKAFVKKGERTKAILDPIKDAELIKACAKDFDDVSYETATEGGHKFNMKNNVESKRQIFKSKLLEGARNLTNVALEKSDIIALKKKYKKALAGYLKANGYDASILKTDNEFADKARAYAVEQAKIATFHADNKFADILNDWSRSARERGGIGGKLGEVLIESTMPFKRTPANILKQGFEYSPLGMLKLVSEIRSQEGANAYIDTISKGLTGTAILGLGAWLASRGLLVGKRDDDDDLYQKGSDYALQIGDKSYTVDWTAPAAMPMFVGAELYKMFNPDESADEAKNFFEALASVAEPAINMSMLEGLSNTLDAIANAKGDKMSSTAANIATGYVSQIIPTLSGQIARTIDPYRRSTRTNASSYSNPITAALQKSGEKIVNKIPGLSMTNQKYVDIWGEPQKNSGGNLLGRAFQNFISPGYLNDTSLSDREEKLATLEKTYEGSGSLIPSLAKSNKPDGTRMTNAEYEQFAKVRGTEMQKAVDAALKYQNNKGVQTEDLQDCVHDIENFANFMAEHKQFNKEVSNTYKKAYEAYNVGGYDGVMNYYLMNKNADLDGNGSITQGELAKYLRKSNIPSNQREALFKLKFPKAKEIPSLK